jgi:hypothetical protein
VEAAARTAAVLDDDYQRAGDLLWLRVERQTFVRLPESRALAFGIYTYSHPLSSLAGDNISLAALHRLLGEYSQDRLIYSAMLAIKAPLMRWLEASLENLAARSNAGE